MSLSGGTAYVDVALGKTDDLKRGIASAGEQAADTAKSSFLGRVGSIAIGGALGNALTSGVSGAFNLAKGAVFDFNSQLQQADIGFTTMLGSSQKAGAYIQQLQQFAKSTPFEFGDLVSNAQQMMGMGIAAQDVIPDLKALGDSVASIGGSAQQVDSVTLAFDQMNAKGTLDMGNMNQLMQNGVPSALKVLAAHYKVTTGEMITMISTGKVQASEALPALVSGIEKGTSATAALGGMMDKQSQTMAGALSNIKDSATQAIAGAFKPLFDAASASAQHLANFLGSDAITNASKKVADGLSRAFDGITAAVNGVKDGFQHAYDYAGKTVYPITELGVKARKVFDTIKEDLQGLVEGFKHADLFAGQAVYPITAIGVKAREAWDKAKPLAEQLFSKIKEAVQEVGPILKTLFLDRIDTIKTVIGYAIPIVENLAKNIGPVLGEVLKAAGDLVMNHVLPALLKISEFIQQKVIPVVADFVAFAVQKLVPLFHEVGDVIAQKVAPMIGRLVDLFVQKVLPALQPLIKDGFGLLKDVIAKLTPIVQDLVHFFAEFVLPVIEHLATFLIGSLIPFIAQVADVIIKILKPAFDIVVFVIRDIVMPIFKAFVLIFLGIYDTGIKVADGIIKAVHGIADIFSWMKDQFHNAVQFISDKWDWIVGVFKGIPGKLQTAGSAMWDWIKDAFKGVINVVIGWWDGLRFKMPSVDTHIPGVGKVGGFEIGVPYITPLAAGGLVLPQPGGTVVRVAEAGEAEIVAPERAIEAAVSRAMSRGGIGRDAPLIGTVNLPADADVNELSEHLYFHLTSRGG